MQDRRYSYPYEKFFRVKPSNPCPICGKADWCGFNSYLASCMRIKDGAFTQVNLSNGQVAYLHWIGDRNVNVPVIQEERFSSKQVAPVKVRDRVYRDFLSLLSLETRHKDDLIRRGLNEIDIKKNGYKSVPKREKPWNICRRLMEMGHDLNGIPGFYLARGCRGRTYWTFNCQPGYYIPVRDIEGRIQALQRRMDDPGKGGKYKLFSGYISRGGCSSGTPAHAAIPDEIIDKRIWITEGPLKADIAAKYLGAIVIGAMSAVTWKPVIPVVVKLGFKNVVIAYDRDVVTRPEVRRAYLALKAKLETNGLTVSRAKWNKEKGIDDALISGIRIIS